MQTLFIKSVPVYLCGGRFNKPPCYVSCLSVSVSPFVCPVRKKAQKNLWTFSGAEDFCPTETLPWS